MGSVFQENLVCLWAVVPKRRFVRKSRLRITGDGFGIPIVLRYCLELCSSISEALELLKRIPVHMSYNITLLDADLNYATIYMVPDDENLITDYQVGTNHQGEITWSDYAIMTKTMERMSLLESCILSSSESTQSIKQKFLPPPLFNNQYSKAFGTLYTASYSPLNKSVDLLWPGKQISLELADFVEQKTLINLKARVNRLLSI